jgi:protein O-mannosyl-transferase
MKDTRKMKHALSEGKVRRHLLPFALITVSTLLAYSNSISGPWAMDDFVANRPVSFHDLDDIVGFRKIAYLTFLFNQWIAPFNPANFRIFNILIHIVNAVLVYVITFRTLGLFLRGREGDGSIDNISRAGALIAGLIFALHPININAVAYIVQRMASLAAMFVLLSLLAYFHAVSSDKTGRKVIFYAVAVLFVILGIFSKENAVLAVPLIILYDYVFLSDKGGMKAFARRVFPLGAACIAAIAIASYALNFHLTLSKIAGLLLHPSEPMQAKAWMAVDVYWTPLQHLLTEFRVVARYLSLIAFPSPSLLVFDWWGFPVSTGLTSPLITLISVIFLISLLVFAVVKLRRFPLLCFGILWYLIAISLESFVAIGSDLYFEHRNYLPAAGLFMGLAGEVAARLKPRVDRKHVWIAAGALCLIVGSLTFSRNMVWRDAITLWSDTISKSPGNIRAAMALGNTYMKNSDFESALRQFAAVAEISKRDERYHYLEQSTYSMGMAFLFKGDLARSRQILQMYGYAFDSYKRDMMSGFYKALSGDSEGALASFQKVLKQARGVDRVVLFTLMGDVYRRKGDAATALKHYEDALSLDPHFSAAHYGMGLVSIALRDTDSAQRFFEKALSADPHNVLALSDMADLMLMKKADPSKALAFAEKAVSAESSLYQPYLTMGNVLIVMGQEEKAESFYHMAASKGVAPYMVSLGRARAYFMRGDREKAGHYISMLKRDHNLPAHIKSMLNRK